MTTIPDFTGYSDEQIKGAIAYTVAVCPRPLLLQIAHHQWADATGGTEDCDLTATPDEEVRRAIRNMLDHTSRGCDNRTAIAIWKHVNQWAPEPEVPERPPILWGCTVGGGMGRPGWEAVTNYAVKVGAPAVIRTYNASFPKQVKDCLKKYPTTPQVIGPKTIGWSDAQVLAALDVAAQVKAQTGRVWICANPEYDRHIRKSGWKLADVFAAYAQWHRVASAKHPGLVGDLWANLTGADAKGRFPGEVTPILPYIAGIGVDGYTYAKEISAQASLTDSLWAKAYADRHGKRFGMMEQGVEYGDGGEDAATRQTAQLLDMLEVASMLRPEVFLYCDTQGPIDSRLTDKAAAAYRQYITNPANN